MDFEFDDEFIGILLFVVVIIIVGGVLGYLIIFSGENSVERWSRGPAGTINEINLMASSEDMGMIFKIDGDSLGIWHERFEGKLPRLNQTGIFYWKSDGDNKKYKWVVTKNIRGRKKHIVIDLPSPNDVVLESQVPINWQSTLLITPTVNKTVLVKYKNEKILAYLNNKNKWKLEVNRKKVLGGKTIRDIKEWKAIPR